MRSLLFMLVLLGINPAFGQAPSIQWQKSLGGSADDIANAIQPTADGGFIVAGQSSSNDGDVSGNHGGTDYWIVKLDAAGNKVWQKSLGGFADDIANAIQQTSDGGYIVAGYTFSNDGNVSGNHNPDSDGWVVKLDAAGNLAWQKALGGVGGDFITAIQQTTDGGYIAGGYSASNSGDASGNNGSFDFWVIKLDASGNISWHQMIGGSQDERAQSLQQTADGGYIMAGSIASVITGQRDCLVVKLDASGNLIWQKTQGGTGNDEYRSIQQTTDGGYIAAGKTASNNGDVSGNHGGDDYWVVKLDASGNIAWQKTLGGSATDWGYAVQQTSDGGYVTLGISVSNDGDVANNQGNGDFWVAKLNASGNLSWQRTFGGTGGDYGYAIRQTADGGFITAGFSNSTDGDVTGNQGNGDFWVVKLGAAGTLPLNLISFTAAASGNDVWLNWLTANEINTSHFDIEFSRDGISFEKIAEQKAFNTGGNHLYGYLHLLQGQGKLYYRLRQVDNNGAFEYSRIAFVNMDMKLKDAVLLYPNPATNGMLLKNIKATDIDAIQVIAADGKIIIQAKASTTLYYNVSNLAKGSYFLRIQKKDGTMENLPFVKQ